jgi:hypothetical protein
LSDTTGKKYQTPIDAATDATKKYEEAIKSAGSAVFELGNQGSMAFDGILGGVNAVAGAFTNLGTEQAKLDKQFQDIGDNYAQAMKTEGMTLSQREDLTKRYYQDKASYEQRFNCSPPLAAFGKSSAALPRCSANNPQHAKPFTVLKWHYQWSKLPCHSRKQQ